MTGHAELPKSWYTTLLGDIAFDISYGYTAASSPEPVGPRMLRITDIQNNSVNWKDVPYCKIREEKQSKYLLENGDLVFARTGATVGKSFLVKGSFPAAVYASYLIRVRCTKEISIKYLTHFFRSPTYWSQITDFSSGVGQPNVNGTKLKSLAVPVAPLPEQTRIENKLDELLAQVDTIKARVDAIPAIMKRFRQSVLEAAVSGRLTEEWRTAHSVSKAQWERHPLEKLIVEMRNGLSPKPNEDGRGTPILRISSVRAGQVDQSDIRHLECDLAVIDKYKLFIGDILFTRYNGSLEFVGVCGLIQSMKHETLLYPDKLIRIRTGDTLQAEYLEIYFSSQRVRRIVTDFVKSTSGQKGISGKDLKSVPVELPTLEEQQEIVRRVESLFTFADQIEQRVADAQARINQLTQSILAKAFRGELVPQDPNDEPASVLLERIKAEREAAASLLKSVKKKKKRKMG